MLSQLFRYTSPIWAPISGSILYISMLNWYYKTFPTIKWTTPFKLKHLLNPGLVLGGIIGIKYVYLGEPIIPYVIRKNK